MRNDDRRSRYEETLMGKMSFLRELCGLLLAEYYRDPMLSHIHVFYYLSSYEGGDNTKFSMQLFLINHFSRGYCIANPSRKVFFSVLQVKKS
mgnify:CR=1 FL=1